MISILPVQSQALSCLDPYPAIPADYEGAADAFVRDFWIERLALMFENSNSIWIGVLAEGAKGALEDREEVRWSRSALRDLQKKEIFGATEVRVFEAYSFSGTIVDENGAHDLVGHPVELVFLPARSTAMRSVPRHIQLSNTLSFLDIGLHRGGPDWNLGCVRVPSQ